MSEHFPQTDIPAATDSKAEWRRWARTTRADLPNASAALCGHLSELLRRLNAHTVLAYRHLSGEPDIAALQGDFRLLTTRARFKPERRLTLHTWDSATEVSHFGVLQPPASTPEVPLSEVDAVVLPGLAFDRSGIRLGYGGGFYDRLLPHFQGPVIGVVWDALLLPEDVLPREAHDCPAGWVVSEAGAWQVGG